jgi:fructose-bisphosphate aldolase class II
MLVNLRDILAVAEQKGIAVAAINVPSLEALRAALDAAEETGLPVIVQHAECHEEFMPLDVMGPTAVALAEQSSAMVCVHLDHCEHLDYLRRALDLGFTGAMYDGSLTPYAENVANSCRAKAMCESYDCSLECELGSMGAREGGGAAAAAIYTDPSQAREFVETIGLDALAVSFGTVHGLYKAEPKLNFDILREIREQVQVPLVMHGGSGVSNEDYHKAINAGIRKINYFTYGAKYAGEAASYVCRDKATSGTQVYWQDLTEAARVRFEQDFRDVLRVFALEK